MSDTSLLKQLSIFGLTEVESRIYLYLQGKEPLTVVEISYDIKLPRTTIYDNILKLIDKGLVKKHILYKTQRFEASAISILQTLIDSEKSKVEQLEKGYELLKQNLSTSLLSSAKTEVRYYHGTQGFMQMLWNSLEAKKETVGYSVFGRKDVVGEKFIERFTQEVEIRHITDRVITNPTPEIIDFLSNPDEKRRRTYQETRYIDPLHLYISGDTTIYNNVFAVSYWQQGEVVGVEIENAELVKTQKSIFEEMWRIAKTH